jgi:hypothetical protein
MLTSGSKCGLMGHAAHPDDAGSYLIPTDPNRVQADRKVSNHVQFPVDLASMASMRTLRKDHAPALSQTKPLPSGANLADSYHCERRRCTRTSHMLLLQIILRCCNSNCKGCGS